MNVIFEGISGAGKSTIYNKVCNKLDYLNIDYEAIGDLQYETPIKKVLLDLVEESPIMKESRNFKTSLYESLLLAANHHYVQEKLRNSNKICLYDRDYISLLTYQKEILKSEYQNYEEIYELYKKIVLFDLKKIDYIFHVDTPIEICIERTEKRDERKYSEYDIRMLKQIKQNFIEELKDNQNVIMLKGNEDVNKNSDKVLQIILKK